MPVTCPHCAAVNPDSNAYCATCGQPMVGAPAPVSPGYAATAPVPSPVAPAPGQAAYPAAPYQAAPVAYAAPAPGAWQAPTYAAGNIPQNPYYAPPPGYPPQRNHRLSGSMILGVVGGLAAILTVVAVGVGLSHKSTPVSANPSVPIGQPTQGPGPTQGPAPTQGPVPTQPVPTRAPQPTPTGPAPTSAPVSGQVVTTSGLVAHVPQGFSVAKQTDLTIVLVAPDKSGAIVLNTGQGNGLTTQQLVQQLSAPSQSEPDAQVCSQQNQATTLQGANGPVQAVLFAVCGTLTTQSGQSTQIVDIYAAGVSANGVVCVVDLESAKSTFQQFVQTVSADAQATVFKLAG